MKSDFTTGLAELSEKVGQVSDIYARRFDIERDDVWYLAKLTEELGELNAAYLSLTGRRKTHDKSDEALQKAVSEEAADLLAHLLLFAQHAEIDLEKALREKWFSHL